MALGAYLDSDNPIRGGVLGAIGVTGFGALVKGKSGKAGAANNLEYALGLVGTELARAQATTIRLRLFKIGAQVRVTARRVWIQLAASFPLQELFSQVSATLRC